MAKPKKTTKRKTKEKPGYRDGLIGARIKRRRRELGWMIAPAAEKMGISFQLLQKYEHGDIRVMANRLPDFSRVLGVPIEYFYQDFNPRSSALPSPRAQAAIDKSLSVMREGIVLVEAFCGIPDRKTRKLLIDHVRKLQPARGRGRAARDVQ